MPELPLELCQAIVDEVGADSDLLRLLLVSINFNSAVERRLYHAISFSGESPPPDVIKRKWGVFERISTCPRVAAHVFHLTFYIQSWSLPPLTTTSVLAKVFLSVPNLKTLRVSTSHDLPRHFQTRVPFLLRTFSCSRAAREYEYPSFRHAVEIFLEAQVELEELEFLADYDLRFTPSALPKLTTVSGWRPFLHAILPGRPVTRVAVQYGGRPVSFDAGPLSSLSLPTNTGLHFYPTSFPTLKFLQYRTLDYEHAQSIVLKCLLALKKLKVMVTHNRKEIPRRQLAFVYSTFAGCPSLCYIETHDTNRYNRPLPQPSYSEIWTRDSQTGIPSSWDSDEWKRW